MDRIQKLIDNFKESIKQIQKNEEELERLKKLMEDNKELSNTAREAYNTLKVIFPTKLYNVYDEKKEWQEFIEEAEKTHKNETLFNKLENTLPNKESSTTKTKI